MASLDGFEPTFCPAAGRNAHSPSRGGCLKRRRWGMLRGSDSYIRMRAISKTTVAPRWAVSVVVYQIAKLVGGGMRGCGVAT